MAEGRLGDLCVRHIVRRFVDALRGLLRRRLEVGASATTAWNGRDRGTRLRLAVAGR